MDLPTNNAKCVLVVDDDPAIRGLIRETLQPEGFTVEEAGDGAHAVELAANRAFDLIILDIMMPGMDGFEVCKAIRQQSEVPIVFLSAKDEEVDKVIGFTLGADDYVTKPFKPRELIARVKARLRRSRGNQSGEDIFSASGIEVNILSHQVFLHGVTLELTPKEFAILALLVRNAGRPVSTKELFEGAWNEPYRSNDANTVMVHIRRLRKKLAEIDSSQAYIETMFGVGYRIGKSGDPVSSTEAGRIHR